MSPRNPTENLFEESRMSFGEHLEELRVVLIRSVIGIAVGCVIGFFFAESVVKVLQIPLENALTNYYVKAGKNELRSEHGYVAPELATWFEQEKIPETVLIEPGQLVAALRAVSPDFLQNLSLKPYRFCKDQFDRDEVAAICRRWSERDTENEGQKQQWEVLWSLLSESEQRELDRIGDLQVIAEPDFERFVATLNQLLSRREIAETDSFVQIIEDSERSLTDMLESQRENPLLEMKQQLDRQFDPDLLERLNRLLIARSFGEAIADVQMQLLPLTLWKSARFQSQSLGATETFMIWVKAGVVAGLVISCPWVFFQIWTFVAAGLYPTEQRYIYVFLPISLLLFFSGVFLAFFFVFEPVLDFLFSFNARMGISPQPRINDWLSFVLFLPLGFGIAFQLPLVMLFINRIDLVSVDAYLSKWRVAVVAIFGISMLLTPADPISMIMLAVPLTGLYFLGIGLCYWLNKPRNPFAAGDT